MAELNQDSGGGKKGGKVRSKKNGGRVDLTAMVDLAFLLITFFMLTTSLNKPQAMDVAMPDKNKDWNDKQPEIDIADNRSITLLLGSDNKIAWYYGQLAKPITPPTVVDYSKEGIRQLLLEKKAQVPKVAQGKDLIVVIRPSDQSVQRNLVDILDEMKITDIKRYMISKIKPEEVEVLKTNGIYND
ncbi:biopolymer transporter ExbD [Sphingobacterium sp. DK4209]|uniref:Biopolymer transporter ExbD n=1 Tax=Sphingobacterium zhuxiongii TaxID=2662364 RepID=A0A5Q0QDV9_9SPHI|nr:MULTISPECIES: biopolymer transporter ExbD [unclassified Sphingobacterium]MVZ66780.1 biopolymer transporter ExbD [Sphingobacterium sp. DK4209]QGA28015.1 biopolymer transporter ExbD [Sphingobacterium sp. dk4302]